MPALALGAFLVPSIHTHLMTDSECANMSSSRTMLTVRTDQVRAVTPIQTTIASIPDSGLAPHHSFPEELPADTGPHFVANRTYLDSYTSSVDLLPEPNASQRFLFGELWPEKASGVSAMMHVVDKPARIARAANCGRHTTVYFSPSTGRYKFKGQYCNQRLCPICARRMAYEWSIRIKAWMEPFVPNRWRFVTLTVRSNDAPLVDQLAFLRASFRRLRQTLLWSRTQNYGRAFIEITYNRERRQWHPHLHVISHGRFMKQTDLAAAWEKSSNGSTVVHIASVKSTEKAVKYLTKYASKGSCCLLAGDSDELWRELAKATSGRRMVIQFGEQNPLPKLSEISEISDVDDWEELGSIGMMIAAAKRGNERLGWHVCNLFGVLNADAIEDP